jgi:hypothetical protein
VGERHERAMQATQMGGREFRCERVRQIENRTLKKLQTLPEAQRLREAS